jgi:hypothetical protein
MAEEWGKKVCIGCRFFSKIDLVICSNQIDFGEEAAT